MGLLPGLPDDVGLECLVRVPYDHFSSVASVCKSWKLQIQQPEFMRRRKAAGCTSTVIVMAQAHFDPTRKSGSVKLPATPVYRLTLCEPENGYWTELPPVPGYTEGLPMFCQLVGVGLNLVVMGGWNPDTWEVSNAVFVYSFSTASWRRGADMPGCRRSFFACASDLKRTVFVAGGHDDEKNALSSALAYDVAKDKWVQLPDMAMERDESKGAFQGGKFHVIGGYHTNMQGRFTTSAESFDLSTCQWDPVQNDFLDIATCPRTCVGGAGDGRLLMCRDADVAILQNSKWQAVTQLPADIRNVSYVTAWQGNLLLIGSPRFSEPHKIYMLDLQSYTWTKVETRDGFSGHVQSGCCLQM
ncbi:F-box/kelch-repeat protein At1g80440-like [Coffea arabica]|uniref:F-box/kelch-repeat protein At1g80440-like n=1 Tax=Coffea arabica TaxID=13443 RepID=A0A6P6X6T6_COFAR|nr:F-box/kelch-repeat protein At1g80440-like [Coffea arabica]